MHFNGFLLMNCFANTKKPEVYLSLTCISECRNVCFIWKITFKDEKAECSEKPTSTVCIFNGFLPDHLLEIYALPLDGDIKL